MAARVLVVDDSEAVRQLIAVNLELEGIHVEQCADGAEALARIAASPPDLVTLDVRMPTLDGFETVRRLRSDPSTARIPVVLVTGRASPADLALGERLGVDAYLVKPFEPAELVSTVLRLLPPSAR